MQVATTLRDFRESLLKRPRLSQRARRYYLYIQGRLYFDPEMPQTFADELPKSFVSFSEDLEQIALSNFPFLQFNKSFAHIRANKLWRLCYSLIYGTRDSQSELAMVLKAHYHNSASGKKRGRTHFKAVFPLAKDYKDRSKEAVMDFWHYVVAVDSSIRGESYDDGAIVLVRGEVPFVTGYDCFESLKWELGRRPVLK